MKKTIFIISALAVLMALVLTACGGNDTSDLTSTSTNPPTSGSTDMVEQTDEENLGSTGEEGGTGILEEGEELMEDASDKLQEGAEEIKDDMEAMTEDETAE